LRAGQLAQLAGLSTDTLRHYERKGLLTPGRSSNGYREYPPGALARVRLIQQALSVGFRLDELARVLSIRDHGGAPCHQVRALAAEKLESIESQLSNLKVLRRQLRGLLREWDARLARTPKGEQAGLLDRLSESTIRPALRRASPSPSWNLRRR
jgi:DNA-binding transcriptional MerR regulator